MFTLLEKRERYAESVGSQTAASYFMCLFGEINQWLVAWTRWCMNGRIYLLGTRQVRTTIGHGARRMHEYIERLRNTRGAVTK